MSGQDLEIVKTYFDFLKEKTQPLIEFFNYFYSQVVPNEIKILIYFSLVLSLFGILLRRVLSLGD